MNTETGLKIVSKSELFAVRYAIEEYYHNVTKQVDFEKLSPFAVELHNSVKDLHDYFRGKSNRTNRRERTNETNSKSI